MHLVVPTHPYFFWVVCHPNRTFPLKEPEQEPHNRFSLLFTARSYPFLPLTHDPPLLYSLGTGWWCLGLAHALVLCTSKTCPLLMRLPWSRGLSVHSTVHPWPLIAWIVFWFLIFYGLLLSRVRLYLIMGFSFFSLVFAFFVVLLPFLSCHSAIPTVVLCSIVHGSLCPSMVIRLTYVTLGFLDPLYCLWTPLAHFFLLEHPWPICFPWASSAHLLSLGILGSFSNFTFPWTFTTLLGFPSPIIISFIFGVHGLSINPLLSYFIISGLLRPILTFLHHMMPMGLLFFSLGSFRPICFP